MKVCLDSRLIKKGDYFVPVLGEENDGHKYIEVAIKNGARGVIEEQDLYKLASKKLFRIKPFVIAITGSVGKTTTREYVSQMLSNKYSVCVGNLNTKLGLAVNIINNMSDDCKFFVAECGMDKKGELTETGNFIKPKIVVLTNVSESHLGKLGSLQDVKNAKAELVRILPKNGVVYVNQNSKNAVEIAKKYAPGKLIYYGDKSIFSKIFMDNLRVNGEHNIVNAHAAYLLAKYFKVNLLYRHLKKLKQPKGRFNKLKGVSGSIIYDDSYNSSPESCINALKSIDNLGKKRKTAILGGMLELGSFETTGHRKVGDFLSTLSFDYVVLVGELAQKINTKNLVKSNLQIFGCKNPQEASTLVLNKIKLQKKDIILVKASQGIRLEKTVKLLLDNSQKAEKLLVRQDARWQ